MYTESSNKTINKLYINPHLKTWYYIHTQCDVCTASRSASSCDRVCYKLQAVECVEWFLACLCWWGHATTATGLTGSTKTYKIVSIREMIQVCVCVCVNYHCMGFPQGCRRLSLCFSGSNKNTPNPLEKTLQFFHVARDDVAEFVSCGFLTVLSATSAHQEVFSVVSHLFMIR